MSPTDADVLEVACARCGGWAMRIRTTAPDDPLGLPHDWSAGDSGLLAGVDGVRTEVDGTATWRATEPLAGGIEAVRAAMRAGDVASLHAIHPEIVPLYCPTCEVSYCRTEWRLWDLFDPDDPGWYDETRGLCPLEHERRVYD